MRRHLRLDLEYAEDTDEENVLDALELTLKTLTRGEKIRGWELRDKEKHLRGGI
jgi:hypothetical protein